MAYQRKDTYYQRAKAQGYRSRAAYKLVELQGAHGILRRGDKVLDLGAWPGGWLQVAAQIVGAGGRVVGVDLQAIEPLPQAWIRTVFGDIRDENVQAEIATALGGRADVLLSDLAPKLTGIRDRDEAQTAELARLALQSARHLLRPGGTLVVKLFENTEKASLVAELKAAFQSVRLTKPESTRKGSAECYAIARGHRNVEAASSDMRDDTENETIDS